MLVSQYRCSEIKNEIISQLNEKLEGLTERSKESINERKP